MTLLVVDGNNLAMRSAFAARGAMTSRGVDTGAIQLFVNSLSRHFRDEQPDRMLICWDLPGPGFRHQIFPEYKAHRRKVAGTQDASDPDSTHELFALIKRFCKLAGVEQWAERGLEADDLIASVSRLHGPQEKVVILSSDKDLLQLLGPTVEQVRFSSYHTPTDRWTEQRVIEELGYRPDQIPLMMALTGDASDGIPGMRGVGPKRALKMLQGADWDLDRAMAAHPDSREVVSVCLQLVDLNCYPFEVPQVPVLNLTHPGSQEWDELISFCRFYQLQQIEDRLQAGFLWSEGRHAAISQ